NVLRQSRCDAGAVGERHLRGYPARRRAGFYRRATGRGCGCNGSISVARAVAAERCRCGRALSSCRTEGQSMSSNKRVLILCTGNSARSQMAEGLLRHDAGERFEVESAGTKASFVRPEAIAVMREVGIDITGHRSKNVDEFEGQQFD